MTFTLLRICGAPRISYHAGCTPPGDFKEIAKYFDDASVKTLQWIIDPNEQTPIPGLIAHDTAGYGLPKYTDNHIDVYNSVRRMALMDLQETPHVEHVTSQLTNTANAVAEADSQYLFYSTVNTIQPATFRTALAIRGGITPPKLRLAGHKCNCGHHYTPNEVENCEHVFRCDQATPCGHTQRHNAVRDSMIHTTRSYGITTTKEPTHFTYTSGTKQRPDIMFHTTPREIVTDVTLTSLHPATDEISKAEKKKSTTHDEAVSTQQKIFIACALATRGRFGPKAEHLIKTLSHAVQPAIRYGFIRTIKHAMSTAAAKGRAEALAAAAARTRPWN